MLIFLALVTLFLLTTLPETGRELTEMRNRVRWLLAGLALLLAWHMPHPALAILTALIGIGLWRLNQMWEKIGFLSHVLLWAAGVVLIAPHVTEDWLVPAEWALVAIGSVVGLHSWYSLIRQAPFLAKYWLWKWQIRLWERNLFVTARQGNPNHLQALGAICVAAVAGLVWDGHWEALWSLPLVSGGVLAVQFHRKNWRTWGPYPTQGLVYLWHLALAWWVLVEPVSAMWGGVAYLCVIPSAVAYRLDSDRIFTWKTMIVGAWWRQSWLIRLFGQGPRTWAALHEDWCKWNLERTNNPNQTIMTVAHNEYVHQLIEYGAVGCLALAWYSVDALYFTALHRPPLFFLGVVLCSAAFLSFPWAFYHEKTLPRLAGASPNAEAVFYAMQQVEGQYHEAVNQLKGFEAAHPARHLGSQQEVINALSLYQRAYECQSRWLRELEAVQKMQVYDVLTHGSVVLGVVTAILVLLVEGMR